MRDAYTPCMHTHDTHACRSEVLGLHACAHMSLGTRQVMLLVNASRMIERRLNKIARLHVQQRGRTRHPGKPHHSARERSRRTCPHSTCPHSTCPHSTCPRARWPSSLRGQSCGGAPPAAQPPGAYLRRRQRHRLHWLWRCPSRRSCMPTAPPATSARTSTSRYWSSWCCRRTRLRHSIHYVLGLHVHLHILVVHKTHAHAHVCVVVVLQANPPQLLSTISFISRFRSPEALRSLEGCYFTHFRAAVAFLETFEFEDHTATEDVQRQLKDFAGRAVPAETGIKDSDILLHTLG